MIALAGVPWVRQLVSDLCGSRTLTASPGLIWPQDGYASIACGRNGGPVGFLPLAAAKAAAPFLAGQKSRRPAILHCAAALARAAALASGPLIAIEAAMGAARGTGRRPTMATIGSFTKAGEGFTGTVKTLGINAKATLRPAEKGSDKAPDYRVFADSCEFGAAWKKTSGEGRCYLSVKLDDPSFPAPIYATLVEAVEAGSYSLIWSRRNGD